MGCDSCVSGGYETCGECQPGLCHHPWLWSRAKSALSCGAGCGDVYWGEWASDPPACDDGCGGCDSCGECDTCGAVGCGGGCGFWNPFRGLAHLWGYRYAPAGYGMGYDLGYDGGCDSCGESYDTYLPGEEMGEVIEESLPTPRPDAEVAPEPPPSKQASVKRTNRTATTVVPGNRAVRTAAPASRTAAAPTSRTVKHLPASHRTTSVRRD